MKYVVVVSLRSQWPSASCGSRLRRSTSSTSAPAGPGSPEHVEVLEWTLWTMAAGDRASQ